MNIHSPEQNQIVERMKSFYEVFPYPNRPLFAAPQRLYALMTHFGFSRLLANHQVDEAQAIWRTQRRTLNSHQSFDVFELQKKYELLQTLSQPNDKVLMVGCGTDEPLLFRTLHPQLHLYGIDLSEKSLVAAQKKIRYYENKNKLKRFLTSGRTQKFGHTTFYQGDAAQLLRDGAMGQCQHIQCFGVLHHQPQPKLLLEAMAKSLVPSGTLRLMIYSNKGRRLERRVQKRYENVWSAENSHDKKISKRLKLERAKLFFWQFINVLRLRSAAHYRFKYIGLNPNSVADAFLHPSDHPLAIRDVVSWANEFGLELIFCEGKIDDQGWVAGFESPMAVMETLASVDESDGLASNFIAVFKKKNIG